MPARKATNIAEDDKVIRVEGLTEEMEAFDRLPPDVRQKLSTAPKQHSAIQVEQMLEGKNNAKPF